VKSAYGEFEEDRCALYTVNASGRSGARALALSYIKWPVKTDVTLRSL